MKPFKLSLAHAVIFAWMLYGSALSAAEPALRQLQQAAPTAASAPVAETPAQPLPGLNVPASWTAGPLAAITWHFNWGETSVHVSAWKLVLGRNSISPFSPIAEPLFSSEPMFVSAGSSFDQSLALATQRAKESRGRIDATYQAQAILQGPDGAYYLAALQEDACPTDPVGAYLQNIEAFLEAPYFDSDNPHWTRYVAPITAQVLQPDLRAIVGGTQWMDFR